MSQASGTIRPELWGDKTLQQMRKALMDTQYILNSITDYTPFVKGKNAAGYHGPSITGIDAQNKDLNTDFTPITPTGTSIDIPFDRKVGTPLNVDNILEAQTNLNLLNIYTEMAKDALLEAYDLKVMQDILDNMAADAKIAYNTGASLTEADFKKARELLNTAGAPLRGRYAIVRPVDEAALLSITNFVSADKIGRANLRDGVVGRAYGFDIIMRPTLPTVTSAGERGGDNECALFYQSLVYGFGRQLELKTKTQPNALSISDIITIYSVCGGKIQNDDYAVLIYDDSE